MSGVPCDSMAQEVIITLSDDLDGSAAEETITFALDGAAYEIDLNAKNAAALRKALDKYVGAARKPANVARRATGRRPAARASDVDPKAVRLWARDQGLEISSRGRIPAELIESYRAAGGA